ncbi:MAG: hypothetical protein M3179_00095, partial [Actinomycetota bacterium]|nr:hypothetical protein [Actinomycetota bacterium]
GAGAPGPRRVRSGSETVELDPGWLLPPPTVEAESRVPAPAPAPAPAPISSPAPPPPPPSSPARPTFERRPWRSGLAVLASVVGLLVAGVLIVVLLGRDSKEEPPQTASPETTTEEPAEAASVPGNWVSYRDPATGYTISHPPDWTIRRNGTLTDFRDPETGAYLRVDYTRSPGPSPVADWEEFEPRFAAENAGYRRIQITPTTYSGYDAAIWEFTYSSGSVELRAVDLGFVTGQYGFALNFQSRSTDWDRYQPVFDAFKASFRAPS